MAGLANPLVGCLVAAGLLALYAEPLAAMVRQWNVSPMYSYAFTVPLISAYLLWSRRDALRSHDLRPARALGGIVLAAALAMLVLGQVAAVQIAQQLSFVVALTGTVLLLFGLTHLKIAGPAIAYLLFMLPFWDVFTEPLHWPFQNNSAKLGAALLSVVGVPHYREGQIIALPNVVLEVARECSGVNYLIAVLALAVPLAFLRLHAWWRRCVLLVGALTVAALANGLRVALIGTLAYLEIGSPLHGPFHVLHGLFVAATGYVALFAGLQLLEAREAVAREAVARRPEVASPSAPSNQRIAWRTSDAAVLAAVLWLLAVAGTAPRVVPVALAMPLEQLGAELGPWRADAGASAQDASVAAWSGADVHLRRRYHRTDGQSATLDIWYFEAQRQSREMVNFKAQELHQQAAPRRIALAGGDVLAANLVRLQDETVLFWYVIDGRAESAPYVAKLRSLWTVLRSGRSDGAAVMLRIRTPGQANDLALAALEQLGAQIHAALGRHWRP